MINDPKSTKEFPDFQQNLITLFLIGPCLGAQNKFHRNSLVMFAFILRTKWQDQKPSVLSGMILCFSLCIFLVWLRCSSHESVAVPRSEWTQFSVYSQPHVQMGYSYLRQEYCYMYNVSHKKVFHRSSVHIFAKYWPILTIPILAHFAGSLLVKEFLKISIWQRYWQKGDGMFFMAYIVCLLKSCLSPGR